MPASNYLEKSALEGYVQGKAVVVPTKVFLALTEKAITKTMTGTKLEEAAEAAELTYEGYKRVEIPLVEWVLTEGSGESTASKLVNNAAITIPLNTNVTGKSLAKYFALCDKLTLGNVLFFGKLTEELNITKVLTKVEIEAKKLEISAE